ncbi:MAG: SagB/ThcOx family dehydrogenase [Bacteroidales bacterium]|nr:SagB/ThcOx family dehydrogenase [Bacteroidales bacterium]
MRNKRWMIIIAITWSFITVNCQSMKENEIINLPTPNKKSNISIEEALQSRRSVRSYKKDSLSIEQIGQLLWAAYGSTSGRKKTCPSAGATYPLEIYLLAAEVKGISTGLYRYNSANHSIIKIQHTDIRKQLTEASLNQEYIENAPASIIIAADFKRTTKAYGARGERYVYMEVGHCGQNIHLQCESLNLGTVIIGAFEDDKVKQILHINEDPLYIMPIGYKY